MDGRLIMNKRFNQIIIILFILLVGYTPTFASTVEILLPLYSYPTHWDPDTYIWDDVAAAANQAPITAIINPYNGPDGGPPNADYQIGLSELRNAGVTMIGYVYTNYGTRDLADVKADIDVYNDYFDIDGIFLDEAHSGYGSEAVITDYYQELYHYIQGKPHLDLVIANPGTHSHENYMTAPAADTIGIFEDDDGWMDYVPDAYVANYGSDRFFSLHYIDLAVGRNIKYVYVTDDGDDGNPWDGLPGYWQQELNYVQSIIANPEPTTMLLFGFGLIGLAGFKRKLKRG